MGLPQWALPVSPVPVEKAESRKAYRPTLFPPPNTFASSSSAAKSTPIKKKQKTKCVFCDEYKAWSASVAQQEEISVSTKHAYQEPTLVTPPVGRSSGLRCPSDAMHLGQSTWTMLHSIAAYYPEDSPSPASQRAATTLVDALGQLYPCTYCREHLAETLQTNRPDVRNRHHFEQWLCALHNDVNERTGKPTFDCRKIGERWRKSADATCQ